MERIIYTMADSKYFDLKSPPEFSSPNASIKYFSENMDKKNRLLIDYFDIEALSTKTDYLFKHNSVSINQTNTSRKSLRIPIKSLVTIFLITFGGITFLGLSIYYFLKSNINYIAFFILGIALIIPGFYYFNIIINIWLGNEDYTYDQIPDLNE